MTLFKKLSVFALILCVMAGGAWYLTQYIRAISYHITPTDTTGRAEVILRIARPFDPDEQVGLAQPTAGQLAAGTGFHDHGYFALRRCPAGRLRHQATPRREGFLR